jgi:hypothetical protein
MAKNGYSCVIRRAGTATSMTTEATTNLSGDTYYITAQAKRCIDPTQAWCIKDAGATLAYTAASVNFLFGEVTLNAPAGGAVTINGFYLPLTTASEIISEAKSFSLQRMTTLVDASVFSTTATYKRKAATLSDASLSVDMYLTEAEINTLRTYMNAGTALVIEVYQALDPRFRGFMLIDNIDVSGKVDGLVEASVSFKLATHKSDETTGLFTGYSEKTLL